MSKSVIDFDELRNKKGFVSVGHDSVRHWIAFIEKGNPDDPSIVNSLIKKMTAKEISGYFEPMNFIGWVFHSKGKYIVSPLKKYTSYEFIFRVDESIFSEPNSIPVDWIFEDIKDFIGKRKKNKTTVKLGELISEREDRLSPTKGALAVARQDLNKFPYSAKEIEFFIMERSQKLQEEKGWKVIPPEIGKYIYLEQLSLSGHQFTTLPPETGKLKNLKYFNLEYNRLEAIPSQISQLQKMETLLLGGNDGLVSLPAEIGNCSNLRYLGLKGCTNLKSLPMQIKNCQALATVNLTHCNNRKKIAKVLRKWLPKCEVIALP